jgi:heptosyltransferase-2
MRPYLEQVLKGTSWLDETWHFDYRAEDKRLHTLAVARRMREFGFDLAVLFSNSLRTAALAWLGGAKQRVGYARYQRGPLLTIKVERAKLGNRRTPKPMVDSYLALAEAVGCSNLSRRLELATTDADEISAEAVFRRLGLRRDGAIVALNSTGAYGSARLWPSEHCAEFARRIVAQLNHDVLVLCGPQERDHARAIAQEARSDRVFSMADQPMDLGTAKACIRGTRLVVSTDSGPRHVAAAFGKPLVTLYGPMSPIWGENPTQFAVNLHLDLDCIGCNQRVCPLTHHRCMQGLTVDRVFAAVSKLVTQPALPRRCAA